MSLDNIQLPSMILQDLYSKSLVDLKTGKQDQGNVKQDELSYLGNNQKRIAVIVTAPDALYLADTDLHFLLGILSACKLSMEDIALINISKNTELSYTEITEKLLAEKFFLFGVEPESFGLPLQFPHYQVQHFNDQVYLSSVSLPELQSDIAEKKKLWSSLKKIFQPA
jgi:hypothetical protein